MTKTCGQPKGVFGSVSQATPRGLDRFFSRLVSDPHVGGATPKGIFGPDAAPREPAGGTRVALCAPLSRSLLPLYLSRPPGA